MIVTEHRLNLIPSRGIQFNNNSNNISSCSNNSNRIKKANLIKLKILIRNNKLTLKCLLNPTLLKIIITGETYKNFKAMLLQKYCRNSQAIKNNTTIEPSKLMYKTRIKVTLFYQVKIYKN